MKQASLAFLLILPLTSRAQEPVDPLKLANEAFSRGGYREAVEALEKVESDYRKSKMWSMYVQHRATYLSYVAKYDSAHRWFGEIQGAAPAAALDPEAFTTVDAVTEIIAQAASHQAVFINEAHHVPQHRVLTTRLLRSLYRVGYRYFAAEALWHADIDELNRRGYPVGASGSYIVEPLYAELVREAKAIGFQVVAYEHEADCDYKSRPNECQKEREKAQAQNLIDRILTHDPTARIVVHAGYGHIYESAHARNFPWKPMAAYFKELTGLDPLTVGQTEMHERSAPEKENATYQAVERHHAIRSSVVLRSKATNEVWTDMPGFLDIQVFNPRSGSGARPRWLSTLEGRTAVTIDREVMCEDHKRCLVQAFHAEDEFAHGIPADQVLIDRETGVVDLHLKPGRYRLVGDSEDKKTEQLIVAEAS